MKQSQFRFELVRQLQMMNDKLDRLIDAFALSQERPRPSRSQRPRPDHLTVTHRNRSQTRPGG